MSASIGLLIFVILVALVFDFLNGFHDAANSVATVVSTRVLKPTTAVAWAAFFNFIAFLIFDTHVANTIGKDIIKPEVIDPIVVLAALSGAIFWNIFTWFFGIPSSSSHALVGGIAGAGIAKAGFSSLKWQGLTKIGASIAISPTIGLILGFTFMLIVMIICRKRTPRSVDKVFRKLQLVSAALYSLGHGGNDAQKTMGIITVLLFTTGHLGTEFHVPLWVVLTCHAAMGLGTLFGGWRIVHTMGMKITKLKPVGGFCAETGGALTLFLATGLGIPVSTTHTITGSIMGVGAVNRLSGVRWGVARGIIIAWILTIPASAAVAFLTYELAHWFM